MTTALDTMPEYHLKLHLFLSSSESSCSDSEVEFTNDEEFQNCFEMSTSVIEVLDTTPKMGRRSMALSDIDPKYVSQSGIWEASDVETSRGGSIRIQHFTSAVNAASCGSKSIGLNQIGPFPYGSSHSSGSVGFPSFLNTRFPKLEECAHFHYDVLELPVIKITLRDDHTLKPIPPSKNIEDESSTDNINGKESFFSLEVLSGGQQSWIIQRTIRNLARLDEQIHRCVWDRSFSHLLDIGEEFSQRQQHSQDTWTPVLKSYLHCLSQLPTNQITCGSVLSWFEIDNRGRHIVSSDDAALNTPAVAAALAIRSYSAEAPDELSFKVGEMISVIDLPPPEESIWLRGKLTRESGDLGGINFEVGFFPRECVEIIGEKGKIHSAITPVLTTRKLPKLSLVSTSPVKIPDKPVLRKHGKIISFFRSMMSRPEKRVLQQKGILRERVFNCDLAEHLLNTGTEVPVILSTCAKFIEQYGVSDGIYRISGSLRNTQRLRRLFDAEEIPVLEDDDSIRQDVHAVSSVLKQYFRELPNPLCTYQLYDKFVLAISPASNKERFENIKQVIKELPPPHYRTLEYLMLHLHRMTAYSDQTGMTAQNMAIVWAPNLIRCRDIEGGSAAEFKGVTNHVIVTEFIIRYSQRFFGKDETPLSSEGSSSGRPESLLLASSSPMKLMSLEAAKEKFREGRSFIEVGGGPASLPQQFHTVIDVSKPRGSGKLKNPLSNAGSGLKNFFTRNRSFSKGPRKTSAGVEINVLMNTATNLKDGNPPGFGNTSLRPVKSVESLNSPYKRRIGRSGGVSNIIEDDESNHVDVHLMTNSSPASPVADSMSIFYVSNPCQSPFSPSSCSVKNNNTKTHNRSISHDSYFEDPLQFKMELKNVLIQETLTEESPQSETENATIDISSSTYQQPLTPESFTSSRRQNEFCQPSAGSSSEDLNSSAQSLTNKKPEILQKPKPKPRYSKLRDCQVQTSMTALNDVGVSTDNDAELLALTESTIVSLDSNYRKSTIVEVYQYPTFNEAERQQLLKHYELERNSSADDSSTDTTPVEDPFTRTSIVYSPLIEDSSSSPLANLPQSVIQPVDGLFHCPLFESKESGPIESPKVTERRLKVHPYENVTTLVKTRTENLLLESHSELGNSTKPEKVVLVKLSDSKVVETHHYENVPIVKLVTNAEVSEIALSKLESEFCEVPQIALTKSKSESFEISETALDKLEPVSCEHPSQLLYEDRGEPWLEGHEGAPDKNEDVQNTDLCISYPSPMLSPNLIDLSENSFFESKENDNCLKPNQGLMEDVLSVTCSEETSYTLPKGDLIGDNQQSINDKPLYPTDPPSETPSPVEDNENGEIIRHIDSPLLVDNPLYRIEFENEAIEEKIIVKVVSDSNEKQINLKALNRCNSAPISFTPTTSLLTENHDSQYVVTPEETSVIVVANSSPRTIDSSMENTIIEEHKNPKLLLSKRLSEPLLNVGKQDDRTSLPGNWKIPDAIRLTHRKQSVKELLNKFESTSHESISSMTMSLSPDEAKTSITISTGPGGLPRPNLRKNSANLELAGGCLRDKNTAFTGLPQHHRFSVGDILMTQSFVSGDLENRAMKKESKKGTMIRSDTLPELRNDSAKENDSNHSKRFIIPDKVQQLFEAANTSLDNNNPETRERIERYKLNRRLILREKFSTAHKPNTNSNETEINNKIENRESTYSVDSVFTTSTTIDPSPSSLPVSVYTTESPRKRALSEDVSQLGTESQYKSFKPEQNFRESSKSESSGSSKTVLKSKGIRRSEGGTSSTGLRESTPLEPGRKIKDIAAFFEKKQF